jgi:hypothetical protein
MHSYDITKNVFSMILNNDEKIRTAVTFKHNFAGIYFKFSFESIHFLLLVMPQIWFISLYKKTQDK